MPSLNAPPAPDADRDIAIAARYSRYLERLIAAHPTILPAAELEQPYAGSAMQAELEAAGITDDQTLGCALRQLRQRVMARLIVRDLSARATLDEVVTTVTALAEVTIKKAVKRLHADLAAVHGEPRGGANNSIQQLHVVGMGKLGGARAKCLFGH